MKKLFAFAMTSAMLIACGDDNSSSANDVEQSSSSEEVVTEPSSDKTIASSSSYETLISSSSEKKDEQESSSSAQEAFSSSNQATSSSSNQIISDLGDNKFVIKQIPTFGELDSKPYFYTTQPRCIYKNGVFTLKSDTSDNAYFYTIANDTLTLNHVDLDKVLAGTYEEPSAIETYYGQNTSIESEWERLCYYSVSGDYTSCTQKYSYIISKDTNYVILTYPIDYAYEILSISEKIFHLGIGDYDEMSDAEISATYAENGITVDSSGANILVTVKDKGSFSIEELSMSVINGEDINGKLTVSAGNKKCTYTGLNNPNPIKYCSDEYLPYLKIDSYDGYVYVYLKSNQEEFDACLESLFD